MESRDGAVMRGSDLMPFGSDLIRGGGCVDGFACEGVSSPLRIQNIRLRRNQTIAIVEMDTM